MLSPSEKRFVREWQEQRHGGRWMYYLLYISVGWFICTLILAIFSYLFFQVIFGSRFLYLIMGGGLILSTVITALSWRVNEARLKKIILREIQEGQQRDAESI